uniref:Uncharacterized protein n=1 Tax=Lactuca sativa TaxID=4236 RepID=A0A9R1WNH9_LACSA|nr:hypothetical protein LSAT_V11C100009100 [Lactuca sativa]
MLLLKNFSELQGSLPQIVPVDTETPSGSDLEDSTHALLPRKRKRRNPRPGVKITDPVQNRSTLIEPSHMDQNIESTFTESSPMIQEISSPLPESTPMDQDFRSPIIEEVIFPCKGLRLLTSFEAPELDISKGKSKLLESEFMDVALLQNRVFDLEQSSAEKDLIIGKQDLRISAADPTSQSSSERVVRPAPNANLDTFLSSGPASAQERREKQIRVEQLKGKMLVMKHSDQNARGDHPEMFFRETLKKITNKYGDRSGIITWGYNADKRMWVVKRKSGRIEYYDKKVDFLSWTKVDLFELIHAPFHNPTNDTMAWSFKNFLDTKVKNNFEAAVKAFIGMVATIIDKKLWTGAFDQADVHLVEKP